MSACPSTSSSDARACGRARTHDEHAAAPSCTQSSSGREPGVVAELEPAAAGRQLERLRPAVVPARRRAAAPSRVARQPVVARRRPARAAGRPARPATSACDSTCPAGSTLAGGGAPSASHDRRARRQHPHPAGRVVDPPEHGAALAADPQHAGHRVDRRGPAAGSTGVVSSTNRTPYGHQPGGRVAAAAGGEVGDGGVQPGAGVGRRG